MRIVFCVLALFIGLMQAQAAADRQKPLGDVPLMHEEAEAAGLHNIYDGPWEFFVGGGGAAFDCDGSGFPSVFLAGGKNPARLFVNRSKSGGPLKFEEKPLDIGADPKLLDNVIGAYPIDITGDGPWTSSSSESAANLMLKGGPDCTFKLANRNGTSMAIRAGRRPSPPSGSRARNSRRWRSAITSTATRQARPGARARRTRSIARRQATGPTIPCARRLSPAFARSPCCSPTGTSRASPSLRISNDRQYYRGGEEQLADRAGQDPAALHSRRRLAARVDLRHGDRRGRYRRLGLSGIFPHLDGGREAAEARSGRGRPRRSCRSIATSPAKSARPPTSPIPAATSGPRPPGRRNSPISTTWACSTFSCPKATSSQMPDFAAYDPSNLLIGQWNGKFAEAGDLAGIAGHATAAAR